MLGINSVEGPVLSPSAMLGINSIEAVGVRERE
jgi:hypothetical protein